MNSPVELLVGPPIRQVVYDATTKRVVLFCEHVERQIVVASEDGDIITARRCGAQKMIRAESNCFVLHGPMISLVPLDAPLPVPTVCVNFAKGLATLLALAGDNSFMASSTCQPKVLLSPQDAEKTEVWIQAHSDCVTAIVASSGGVNDEAAMLFTGGRDGVVRKWRCHASASQPMMAVEFAGHTSFVTCLLLCCEERVLVSAAQDATIRFWDITTGEAICVVMLSQEVYSVCENQGVLYTVHQNGSILAWTLATLLQNHSHVPKAFVGHHGIVTALDFCNMLMVSSSLDGTLRVWSTEKGDCLKVLRGHCGPVTGCFFDSRGTNVCSVSEDGVMYRWESCGSASSSALGIVDNALASDLIAPLRGAACLISLVVFRWLDVFLEACAERSAGDASKEDIVEDMQPISESSLESEGMVRDFIRRAFCSMVDDKDLWEIYNARSELHHLFLGFSVCITAIEESTASGHESVLSCIGVKSAFEDLVASIDAHFTPFVSLFRWVSELFHRPKLVMAWERRMGSPVPLGSLSKVSSVVPDHLQCCFAPLIRMANSVSHPQALESIGSTLSMIVGSWSALIRSSAVIGSLEDLVVVDAEKWSVGSAFVIPFAPAKLLDALGTDALRSNLCMFGGDVLRSDVVDMLEGLLRDHGAHANSTISSANASMAFHCLIEWIVRCSDPLFPDLSECESQDEFATWLERAGDVRKAFMARLWKAFDHYADPSQEGSLYALSGILGPLLSHASSSMESILSGKSLFKFIRAGSSLFPSVTFCESPPPKLRVGLQGKVSALVARTASGLEHRCLPSCVGYSLQVPLGNNSNLLERAFGGKVGPGSASKKKMDSKRKGQGTIRKRENTLVLEEGPVVSAVAAGRSTNRRSAADIAPADFAFSILEGSSQTGIRSIPPGDGSRASSSSSSSSSTTTTSASKPPLTGSSSGPDLSFAWNGLIGLLDDIEPDLPAKSDVVSPRGASELFSSWEGPAFVRGGGGGVGTVSPNLQLDVAEDDEIADSIKNFLGFPSDMRSSWRDVIENEDEDFDDGVGEELRGQQAGSESGQKVGSSKQETTSLVLRGASTADSSPGQSRLAVARKVPSPPSREGTPVSPRASAPSPSQRTSFSRSVDNLTKLKKLDDSGARSPPNRDEEKKLRKPPPPLPPGVRSSSGGGGGGGDGNARSSQSPATPGGVGSPGLARKPSPPPTPPAKRPSTKTPTPTSTPAPVPLARTGSPVAPPRK